MARTKEKKIFAFNNFLGLDKENKLLKVSKHRASNGKNFTIDSRTLKTRPAFKYKDKPKIIFEEDDYIIDWHEIGKIKVYVTKNHIYIEDGNFVFNEKVVDNKVVLSFFPTLNHENLSPLFQEEKDCLFIFCLNNIYVFSVIKDNDNTILKYVLYDLKAKPANPFHIEDSDSYKKYEDLPTPYEPTLFIGDSRFEDVNLLSNVSKYKLFAQGKTVENNEILYKLPTHYNKEKNGNFAYDVIFYNDRFKDVEVFPIFLGRPKENFPNITLPSDIEGMYGQFIGNVFEIKETYYSKEEFEILDDSDTEFITKYDIGLSKEEFFNFREKTTNLSVFEFLFNFIKNNTKEPEILYSKFAENVADYEISDVDANTKDIYIVSEVFENLTDNDIIFFKTTSDEYKGFFIEDFESTSKEKFTIHSASGFSDIYLTEMYLFTGDYIDDNRVVRFSLKYNVKATVRNKETNYIVDYKTIEDKTTVYVQLKKYESSFFGLENESVITSEAYITNDSNDDYYPEVPEAEYFANEIYPLTTTPITVLNTDSYANRAKMFITGNRSNPIYIFDEGKIVAIKAKVFRNVDRYSNEVINISATSEWQFAFNEYNLNYPDKYFPNYPAFSNPFTSEYVVESNTILNISGKNPNWQSPDFQNSLKNVISGILKQYKDDPEVLVDDKHGAYLKIKVKSMYGDDLDNISVRCWSIVIPFYYEKKIFGTYEERREYVYLAKIIKERNLPLKLYDFNYNEIENAFELRVKDYFIDYNNEPSIDVKVTFESNPDYDMIAKTKFGITFGSENRLFLAGNKDYKNIDRYNVSNDLLGDNIKSQSYELTYFPSKNYRPVGGNGAINGYVIATDNQLYITKEDYMGDNKLFIRERILDENGIVSYREHKTNISKTPLNNRTIVRFFNDILMLTVDGLYAIEISSNVLTNERLIKLRSSFVNKDLVNKIKAYDKDKIFIVENNQYMYMFIGNTVYVIDSKYISSVEGSAIENVVYEVVEWETPENHPLAKFVNDDLVLLSQNRKMFYQIYHYDTDDIIDYNQFVSFINVGQGINAISVKEEIDKKIEEQKSVAFIFEDLYLYESLARRTVGDYDIDRIDEYSFYIFIENYSKFANIKNGDEIIFKTADNQYHKFNIEEYDGSRFIIRSEVEVTESELILNEIYIINKYCDKKMYVTVAFDFYDSETASYTRLYLINDIRVDEYIVIEKEETETNNEYNQRLEEFLDLYDGVNFVVLSSTTQNTLINYFKKIEMVWFSSVSDFGSSLMEKTMFRCNVYATRQEQENELFIGYKTMRALRSMDETKTLLVPEQLNIANPFSFENFNFSNFSFNTFAETGFSIPMKENNFLYIQFAIRALGNIEINSIELIYKNNRVLKTIG